MPFFVENSREKKNYTKHLVAPSGFIGGAFLQSWEWGDFQRKRGEQIERIIIRDNEGNIVGHATFLLIRNIPFFPYAYCPAGPCLRYEKLDREALENIFLAINRHLSKAGMTFVRFNPPLKKGGFEQISGLRKSLAKTKQPEKTAYLDLKKKSDELLKKMKQKTRYNIRLAEKHDITVSSGNSPKDIEIFLRLLEKTSIRDNFRVHDSHYYKAMVGALKKTKQLQIVTAYHKKRPIAANIIIFHGNVATYLHGASANEKRNLMPTYLLQWKTIEEAKENGYEYYDFWGIDEKKWPGVSRFKAGFGGQEFEMEPTYELPVKKVRYAIYENIRRVIGK